MMRKQAWRLVVLTVLFAAACLSSIAPWWYGEAYAMLLPGVLFGIAPCLMALLDRKKVAIKLPVLVYAAMLSACILAFGYVARGGALTNICLSSTVHLLAGILWGSAFGTAPDIQAAQRREWLTIACVSVLTFVLVGVRPIVAFALPRAQSILPSVIGLLVLVLPLLYGLTLIRWECRCGRLGRGLLCAVSAAALCAIAWAILAQAGLTTDRIGKDLNTMLFRMKGMNNITACMMVICGAIIRNCLVMRKQD